MHKANQTIIGFDFGMKRIGVAVGQTVTFTAQPLDALKAADGIPDWEIISDLLITWQADAFVVGLPLNMDGSLQEITRCAQKFANRLRHKFNRPVYLMDERLTTKAARQFMDEHQIKIKKSGQIDSYAAKIILESWLQNQNDSHGDDNV